MKKYILLFFFVSVLSSFASDKRDEKKSISSEANWNIYGVPKDRLIRVPPPESFYLKSASSAKVVVRYNNFTSSAKKAFQHAVDIWSSLITTSQVIYIDAYWKSLGEGVLGSCGPSNYFMGYDGLPENDMFYPIALAEKLSKQELNKVGDPDLIVNFNRTASWYYGTDGLTPERKYDLVSVVLHELCHGLGFVGTFYSENGIGSWGWGESFLFAFDSFLENASGVKLINQSVFPNYSNELHKAIAGRSVYFSGKYLLGTVGKKATMYSPSIWESGSSIYHLNTSYDDGSDMLMTPSINTQTSIHNPGKIALGILGDIGWKSIRIDHESIRNSEVVADINLSAKIYPDFETAIISPTLYYSIDSTEYIAAELKLVNAETSEYTATIPISRNATVDYYITAKDKYDRLFKVPVTAPEINYQFYIGTDTISPQMVHYYNTFLLPGQDSIYLAANVTDDFGIDTVWVEYQVNKQEKKKVGLTFVEKNKYDISLDISGYKLAIGDSVSYAIFARDKSKAGNVSRFPVDDSTVTMKVEAIPDFVSSLQSEFEFIGGDLILQGFEISVPNGFESGAMHTKHPYEFAGDNSSLNYIAQIRYPVKIAEKSPFIQFDEIVLVEPGEPGTKFGDDEFWDYVIVEGSKDQGKTWKPFIDGYDSRADKEWDDLYNKSIKSQYSQAIGIPSLYRTRMIDMTSKGDFTVGDTVLVRFRLYSDPFAYGWGWAIDNLKIQTEGLTVASVKHTNKLSVYPNPLTGSAFSIKHASALGSMQVNIYDLRGSKVASFKNVDTNREIELPTVMRGVYLLEIIGETISERHKLIVR